MIPCGTSGTSPFCAPARDTSCSRARGFGRIALWLLLAALMLGSTAVSPMVSTSSASLLHDAWPNAPARRLELLGRGIGIVFSPDLSVPDNCRFYQALGFACFQDADWSHVLDQVHRYNVLYPEKRLSTLILETHGTNGNGLKLQDSYDPVAERSYISVGALQERLAPDGIRYVIISACNSGRLLRPEIYKRLNRNNGDRLFLPATRGIVDASRDFEPESSPTTIITPVSSHIETTLVGSVAELSPAARAALLRSVRTLMIVPPREFAVSDMMVQMVTRDSRLELTVNSYVEDLSRQTEPVDLSEGLFRRFITYLNAVAAREEATTHMATSSRRVKPKPKRAGKAAPHRAQPAPGR